MTVKTALSLKISPFILAFLSIMGCTPGTGNRVEGYVHYRLTNNPTTLDPALIVDVQGGLLAAKLFNGLVKLGDGMTVVPDIAERWEIGDGGTTYTFHLRRGVFFHNKREVTAYDFKYSFMRILDPSGGSPNTWVLEKIMGAGKFLRGKAPDVPGIVVEDPYTLTLRLERPFTPFLSLLTMTAAYVVPKEDVERWGKDFGTHPSGTGPFLLSDWRHNDRLIFRRNEHYFDGRPNAPGHVFRVIPEDLTAVAEFELGNLDIISLPASEFSRFRRDPKWKNCILTVPGLNTYYVGFNCSRPPFDDVRLRRAVAHAIDREKVLRTFFEGRGRPATGPVPEIIRRWPPPPAYEFDPASARRMFREAGASGRVINYYVTADQEVVDIAEIIQWYLRDAGLNVRIRQLEWSAYKEALNRGDADMFWIGWWADYPDPENFLFPLFHSSNHGAAGNRTRYTNREVDRLIELGQRTLDYSQRNAYYRRAEGIIAGEAPWVFFWHRNDFIVMQPNVKNPRVYPIYSMDKGTEVSY